MKLPSFFISLLLGQVGIIRDNQRILPRRFLISHPGEVTEEITHPIQQSIGENWINISKETLSIACVIGLLLMQCHQANANNKGTLGEVFPIVEEDLAAVIQKKLKDLEVNGRLTEFQKKIQAQVEKGIRRPTPVANITKAKHPRTYLYDPSIVVPHDLKDHQGRIFQKAGTKINPLDMRAFSKPHLFIDGDDQTQVDWALEQRKLNERTKIILINGSPLDLSNKYEIPFYFDQGGKITQKLQITEVPSRITQQGKLLLVESVPIPQNQKAERE